MKNKLIKGFSFLVLILLCLCFAACGEHREQHDHPNGEKICDLEVGMTYDEASSVLGKYNTIAHRNYIFFKDNVEGNVVVEFDKEHNTISNVRAFASTLTNEDNFQKIKSGMTVFEVVELVGIPTESVTFGISSLDFESQDQKRYRIVWDNEMKVSEIIPVTQGSLEANSGNINQASYEETLLASLRSYVELGYASERTAALFDESSNIQTLPVLGPYLEETDLIVYLFYNEIGVLSGTTTIKIDAELSAEAIDIASKMSENEYLHVEKLSDEQCFTVLSRYFEIYPNFNMLGVIYNTLGYSTIYPVGIAEGETTVKYIFGEPKEFNLVEPFGTIEEGRAAFASYKSAKEKLLAKLQIFKWDDWNEYLASSGYMRKYMNEDIFNREYTQSEIDLLNDHDDMIVIPLTDKDGKEDVFILHILLHKGKPIAEIVLKKVIDDNGGYSIESVKQELSDKDDNGEYIGIANLTYLEAFDEAKKLNKDFSTDYVMFDNGAYVLVGSIGDKRLSFNSESIQFYETN